MDPFAPFIALSAHIEQSHAVTVERTGGRSDGVQQTRPLDNAGGAHAHMQIVLERALFAVRSADPVDGSDGVREVLAQLKFRLTSDGLDEGRVRQERAERLDKLRL